MFRNYRGLLSKRFILFFTSFDGYDSCACLHLIRYGFYFFKVKGLSQEELDGRHELVLSLRDKIEAVQDGSAPGNGWAASTSYTNIRFDTNVSGNIYIYRPCLFTCRGPVTGCRSSG